MRLVQAFQVLIPTGSIQEETVHVAAILWRLIDIVLVGVLGENEEVEGEGVDGVFILNREGGTLRA